MSERATTWSSWREVIPLITAPRQLKKTASVALIVGSAFFAMNQLGVIVAGQATAVVWLKAALTYLTPLLVSSFGAASATRQSTRAPRHRAPVQPAASRSATSSGLAGCTRH